MMDERIFPFLLENLASQNESDVMQFELKIRRVGNALGVVLPQELLQTLKVGEGDVIFATESPDHSLRLTTNVPGFQEKMKIALAGMDRYRNALRELAK